jgi:sialate O-acetylesterase
MIRLLPRVLFSAALGLVVGDLRADVTVAPLFTDNAVVQRDKTIPVWGAATPAEKIVVTFSGQRREATAGPDGRWIALLDPLAATTEGADLVVAGTNSITVRNVVVGEVWLCSGQSNLEWPVARADHAAAEIAAANFPLLRHVKINHTVADAPAATVATTGWQAATPQTVGAFSAVAYFFARDLHQKIGVPIGIVDVSWGGTPIESWMSPAALASSPAFAVVDLRWQQTVAEFPMRQREYDSAQASRTQGEAAARTRGKTAHDTFLRQNPRPIPPPGPGHPWQPRSLFNGMINPLLPYALRGFVWYQGENNVDRPAEYHALFAAMITAWRSHFGQGDLPFFWVNLASFRYPNDPTGLLAAALREAQTKTLAVTNTAQAVAIDIGDPNNIHPTNKQEVGRRLALLARHRVYGFVGDDTGPTFAGTTLEGSGMRVRFTHASGGLIAYHKPVQSLQLAGRDRVFHPAQARIDRDTLWVSSPRVREPVAVRYAWANAPEANLYNGAGLPAVPFRSDDW